MYAIKFGSQKYHMASWQKSDKILLMTTLQISWQNVNCFVPRTHYQYSNDKDTCKTSIGYESKMFIVSKQHKRLLFVLFDIVKYCKVNVYDFRGLGA